MQTKTGGSMAGTARCAVRTPRRGVPTSCERFSSTRSLTCVIRRLDVEQDHDCSGHGGSAGRGACGILRPIMHPCYRTKSEVLSIALLYQRDVLCHIGEQYSSFDT